MWKSEAPGRLLLTGLSYPASNQILPPEHQYRNAAPWLQAKLGKD